MGPGVSTLPPPDALSRSFDVDALRNEADPARLADDFTGWLRTGTSTAEIAFLPGRIMMHDTTCGPALVDIAAMRDLIAEHGENYLKYKRNVRGFVPLPKDG